MFQLRLARRVPRRRCRSPASKAPASRTPAHRTAEQVTNAALDPVAAALASILSALDVERGEADALKSKPPMPKNKEPKTSTADQPAPLANAVILIIRHAGKPASGSGLDAGGRQRADAYVNYFQNYRLGPQPLHLDTLIAAADTAESERSRLTLEPLSGACKLPIDTRFKDQDYKRLARALRSQPSENIQPGGRNILICWHHEEIPALIHALGADPDWLLPKGEWPISVYDWVIQLQYDGRGYLIPGGAARINENLMPGDDLSVTRQHLL